MEFQDQIAFVALFMIAIFATIGAIIFAVKYYKVVRQNNRRLAEKRR